MAANAKNTTKARKPRKPRPVFVPRQPEPIGPDAVFNGRDWEAYNNGQFVGARSNPQDAWILARSI